MEDWPEPLPVPDKGQKECMVWVPSWEPDTSTYIAGVSTVDGVEEGDVKEAAEEGILNNGDG